LLGSVTLELLYLLRDCTSDWKAVLEFIDSSEPNFRDLPEVQEQRALAVGKTGSSLEAAGALEGLIQSLGATSEREGLLGGRYKKLYYESKGRAKESGNDHEMRDAKRYLDKAIQHYTAGMMLDLNDYYPTCNLPRLLRQRGEEGDEDLAKSAAIVTKAACERAKLRVRGGGDSWLNATLLGVAFDAGDIRWARKLERQVRNEGAAAWELESTLADLRLSLELQPDPTQAEGLSAILKGLEELVPKKS
jgi:hypothetical protein